MRCSISVHSRSDARIDLKIPPDYISYSTIENRSRLAIGCFRRLNAYIDKRIELFTREIIQCHCEQHCGKQSAFIILKPSHANVWIDRQFQTWRKIPISGQTDCSVRELLAK